MKRILSFVLVLALSAAFCGCKGEGSSSAGANNTNTDIRLISEYADTLDTFDDKNIVLTSAVFSDVHISGSWNYENSYKQAIKAIEFTTNASVNKKLDAVCIAGDLVDCTCSPSNVLYGSEGYPATYEEAHAEQSLKEKQNLLRVFEDGLDKSTQLFYCLGNHDSSKGSHAQEFIDVLSGENNENYEWFYGNDLDKEALKIGNRHMIINGYHFLALEFNAGKSDYEWLKKQLDAIVDENPAQTIFFLNHLRPNNMTFASAGQDKEIKELLEAYPQVIVFGGHTHSPIDFDSALMQSEKGFISVDCGSVSYLDDFSVGTGDRAAENTTANDMKAISTGLLLEVDKNGCVRISRYNFTIGEKCGASFVIPPVKQDGTRELLYTKNRQGTADEIKFLSDKATAIGGKFTVSVTFPAAYTNQKILRYEVYFTTGDKKSKTYYISSRYFRYATPADMPTEYSQEFSPNITLTPGESTVNITAFDAWGNRSETLTCILEEK